MADYRGQTPEVVSGLPVLGRGGRPVVTWTLLAANALVWVIVEIAGGSQNPEVLLRFGAMSGPYLAEGQYWRLLTAIFLHFGIMHLVLNEVGLLVFGGLVEQVYGRLSFGVIYLVSGLSGSVASFLLNSVTIGVGASGAIFGVVAALAAFFVARRKTTGEMGRQNLLMILVLVAMNLVFGFIMPRVDNWAHLGGLVGGFALGMAFVPRYALVGPFGLPFRAVDRHPLARKWWVLPAASVVLSAGVWFGIANLGDHPLSHIERGERYLENGEYGKVLDEANKAIRLDRSIGRAYYLRGRVLAERGEVDRAKSELSRAIRLGLDSRSKENALALLIELNLRN